MVSIGGGVSLYIVDTHRKLDSAGYRDSAADIAYNLQISGQAVVTPVPSPDPRVDEEWSFPDTERGVLDAIKAGANVLWANTTLHSTHSIVNLRERLPADTRFVGQNPMDTEKFEDKAWVNKWLDRGELQGRFPKSWLLSRDEKTVLNSIDLPAVVKPVRGRGSYGVSVARSRKDLDTKADYLWKEGDRILIEVRLFVGSRSFAPHADSLCEMQGLLCWRGSYRYGDASRRVRGERFLILPIMGSNLLTSDDAGKRSEAETLGTTRRYEVQSFGWYEPPGQCPDDLADSLRFRPTRHCSYNGVVAVAKNGGCFLRPSIVAIRTM
jgi:hypothetical protein